MVAIKVFAIAAPAMMVSIKVESMVVATAAHKMLAAIAVSAMTEAYT